MTSPRQVAPEFSDAGEIHVWEIPRQRATDSESLRAILSRDELRRADRFRVAEVGEAFIFYRSQVRTILSRYLHVAPSEVPLSASSSGKPILACDDPLALSISHRGDLGLLAVHVPSPRYSGERARVRGLLSGVPGRGRNTCASTIGIDLEFLDPRCGYDALAEQSLSPRERAQYHQLSQSNRPAAMLRAWTLKEAYLKAVGVGLSRPLHAIEVDFLDRPPQLLATGDPEDPPRRWVLTTWCPRENWFASLAAPTGIAPLKLVHFSATSLKDCCASPAELAAASGLLK